MEITNISWIESGLDHNCNITLDNGVSFCAASIGTSGGTIISSTFDGFLKRAELPHFNGDMKRFDAYSAKVIENAKADLERRLHKYYA